MPEVSVQIQPSLVEKPAMRIAGFARVFTWDTMSEIPLLWQQAGSWLERITGTTAGESFGAMYIPEPGRGDFGYLAGIRVGSDFDLTPDLSEVHVPATTWAIFPHNGGLPDWPRTIDHAMRNWLPTSGRSGQDPTPGVVTVMERYGPGFDPQTGLGDMQCWVPLKS